MRISFIQVLLGAVVLSSGALQSCSKKSDPSIGPVTCKSLQSATVGADGMSPAILTSAQYLPNTSVIGLPSSKGSVTVTRRDLLCENARLVRFDQPWTDKEFVVDLGSFDATTDFGPNGSISLIAETKNYPLNVGGAFPVLAELYVEEPSGAVTRLINLKPECSSEGMWDCANGYCDVRSSCTVDAGSTFGGRSDWDQHQIPPYGYSTTNAFPRCDSAVNGWDCPLTGGLPSGRYYAKYVLMSDSGNDVDELATGFGLAVLVKNDPSPRNTGPVNGGVNLNLILVGSTNINDSRSTKGARNLDLLFKEVNRLLKDASGAKIGINELKVYEWSNANGGSQYSQVDYLDLGNMFEKGSKADSLAASSGDAINIFLVSDITYANNSNIRILGVSGGILGPPVHGTQTSGLAFSSGDELALFNPKCSVDNCPKKNQESEFLEMAATIAHELGHFLGLNHPSENSAGASQAHDALNDTPLCVQNQSGGRMSQRTCYYNNNSVVQGAPLGGNTCKQACDAVTALDYFLSNPVSPAVAIDLDPVNQTGSYLANDDMPREFCPAVQECQFNHVMWYTTKNRQLSSGGVWSEDGNLFSPQSSAMLQWSPLVR